MNKKHPLIISALLCILFLAVNSCSKSNDDPSPNSPGTTNISILSMSYSPSPATVAKGTVVKWTNTDGTAHTVTADDGTSFDSGNINASGTFSYTANVTGTFNYHCTIHGLTMAGVLVVNP
ncbi:MAG: cupredoxin domain-containing protein [Ferruginibacter sp.]